MKKDTYFNVRNEFPLIQNQAKNLIYFDNAATMQKPTCVINMITEFY